MSDMHTLVHGIFHDYWVPQDELCHHFREVEFKRLSHVTGNTYTVKHWCFQDGTGRAEHRILGIWNSMDPLHWTYKLA